MHHLPDAVAIGSQTTQGDKGVHGRPGDSESLPAAGQNRPAAVKDYRRGEQAERQRKGTDPAGLHIFKKSAVQGKGDHHDIEGEDGGNPDTQQGVPLILVSFFRGGPRPVA